MSEETILSAARRVVRYWRIDEAHGGLTSRDTMIAMDILQNQIEKETVRQREAESAAAEGEVPS